LELHEGRVTKDWEKVWLNKALPRLAVMTGVESIYISHGNFGKFNDIAIAALLSSFSKLTYLRLGYCSFSSVPQFLGLLSASVQLEHLALVSVKTEPESSNRTCMLPAVFRRRKNTVWAKKEGGHVPSISPGLAVAHLRILEISESECGFMKEFLAWLQCGIQVPPVDTLRLNIEVTDDISSYSELMRILGSSLTSLEIQFATRFGAFRSEAAGIY